MKIRSLLWLAWLTAQFLCPSAQAEEDVPASVQVVLAECPSILQRQELIEHLRIELLSTGVQFLDLVDPERGVQVESSPERLATLQIYYPECDDESGVVNLRITDRLTAKYVERALFVGDVRPEARARTVALAVGELLRASWMELVLLAGTADHLPSRAVRNRMITRIQEIDRSALPQASKAEHDVAQEAERRLFDERWFHPRIEWIAGSRIFPAGGSGDLSSSIGFSFPLNRHLRVHTGGLAAGGGTNADRSVHLFEAAGRVGIGVTGGEVIELELSSNFELGWAHLSGQEVKDRGAFMMIGMLHACMRTDITRGLDIVLGLQGGYVLTPLAIVFDDENGARVRNGVYGPVVGVLLGLSGTL